MPGAQRPIARACATPSGLSTRRSSFEPGSPARYDDDKHEWYPPKGMRIKVLFQYEDKGKLHTVRAQEWVKNTTGGPHLRMKARLA